MNGWCHASQLNDRTWSINTVLDMFCILFHFDKEGITFCNVVSTQSSISRVLITFPLILVHGMSGETLTSVCNGMVRRVYRRGQCVNMGYKRGGKGMNWWFKWWDDDCVLWLKGETKDVRMLIWWMLGMTYGWMWRGEWLLDQRVCWGGRMIEGEEGVEVLDWAGVNLLEL